uniref:CRAL-TRIO domain-containing protein n=2 Tax=Hemiselmis andersenii TaxID=464988 RepID=A0A6U4NVU9_HEMAN|mmetsp:Transcript_17648/g.42537  ORF Transcript_17648/g.42537 Transcript_17648/m.42537 type:complete len:339 (+) Transcript_17648:326-1342(+)
MGYLWGASGASQEAEEVDEEEVRKAAARAMVELRRLLVHEVGESLVAGVEEGEEAGMEAKHGGGEAAKEGGDDAQKDEGGYKDGSGEAGAEEAVGEAAVADGIEGHPEDQRQSGELEYIDQVTMRRFLRAYQNNAPLASERILKMQRWRASKSYGLDTLVRDIGRSTEGVQAQLDTGKCVILKRRDLVGRPIISVQVKLHDPSVQTPDELTRFGVHMLLSAEAMLTEKPILDEAERKFCIIFDLQSVHLSNIDYHACKRIIYMLTYFFPERMGVCLLVGAPMFFTAVWHVIKPWLDAKTQKKVAFVRVDKLGEYIAPDCRPSWLGGTCEDLAEGSVAS